MKIMLLILTVLCSAAAFGQGTSVLSNQPQALRIPDHPQHAETTPLASEHSLVGGGTYTYAQGERPLWEFGSMSEPPTPLGDIARAIRKEKQAAKKAEIVFEKQGS